MGQLFIIVATVFAVYNILRLFGVMEYAGTSKKVASDVEDARKAKKKRSREQRKLNMYSTIVMLFRGLLMTQGCYEKHQYFISRLDIRSPVLNRLYTPEELRGKYVFPFCVSLICIPLGVFRPFFFLIPIGALLYFFSYPAGYEAKIRDEDEIIDNYFIDLYLLMYSKLKQGSRARLQGVVDNYIDTLEGSVDVAVKNVMLKMARYLLNLLSLYEDHVAVPMLKEVYRSATIINFCNVASQSLNGIENFDNLLTFKMQLVERKTVMMRKRSAKLVRKGERSIYAIYVILFIFIAIGWYSKLPTGFF